MIEKGLLATIHEPDSSDRSWWYGSAYGNIKHNLSVLRDSPMMTAFIKQILGSTGGVVTNFFAQYYPQSKGKCSDMHGHLSNRQDKFSAQYRLLTTLGDSQFGKKMTFTIFCEEKPSGKNPGKSVTINVPQPNYFVESICSWSVC